MIGINVQILSSLQAVKGLMFTSKPRAVYFETSGGIHTFFLKFRIDVIILDKTGRVVTLKQSLKPWRIYIWNPRYKRVVELPVGTVSKLGIKRGSHVKLLDT